MSHTLRQVAIILILGVWSRSAQAAPGAYVPWITYDAVNMTVSGGTIIGPPAQLAGTSSSVTNTIPMEASGGQAVELTGPGQYVELTAQAPANAIVVRYCVPDTASGGGTNSTISLYQNGTFVQKIPVTSQYSWLYGSYPWTNNPAAGIPRDFFDEVRLIGLTINPGDTVRIEKDADDAAAYDVIDLVDLENVAAPLAQPAGSLAITNYGAVPDGVTDCTAALQNSISAANALNMTVWIPSGTYVISGNVNLPSNTTIQGTGMWYAKLIGSASLYNTTPSRRINLNGQGSNIHLADFAILGFLDYRNDSEGNDGLGGAYGTGSSLSRIWVEHTKSAAWIMNSSGLVIDSCRFRDTIADGININTGMQGTIITNCTARNTGDDCFAIWPSTNTAQSYIPGSNVFTHCNGQLSWLSSGGAIYGGAGNRIEDCLFSDTSHGAGILISGSFPVGPNVFSGTTVAQRCDLSRCGGYELSWPWRGAVTVCPQYINVPNLNLNHLNITNSLSYALQILSPGSSSTVGVLSNSTMNLINISTFGVQVKPYPASGGVYGVWAEDSAYGSLNVSGLTINGAPVTSMPAPGPDMSNQSSGTPQHFAFNFLPAPALAMMASGNVLQLSWPDNYLGWTLQAQTNAPGAGIGANWGTLSGSDTNNQFSIPADPAIGSTFFKLSDL